MAGEVPIWGAIFSYGCSKHQHACFCRDKRWRFFGLVWVWFHFFWNNLTCTTTKNECYNVFCVVHRRNRTFLCVTQQICVCWHQKSEKWWKSSSLPAICVLPGPYTTFIDQFREEWSQDDEICKKKPVNITTNTNFGEIWQELGQFPWRGGTLPLILPTSKVEEHVLRPS